MEDISQVYTRIIKINFKHSTMCKTKIKKYHICNKIYDSSLAEKLNTKNIQEKFLYF